jgi:ABC-type polysaccharide/polyol phosphate export permease
MRMGALTYASEKQRQVWRVFPDLVRSRELLLDLVWKDLRARYRYAVMGFLWAVIEPLMFMLILAFVFSFVFADRAALTGGGGARPFPVMLLCGLIFWQYFTAAITASTMSLVDGRNLVKKVHFTREVIPIAACCVPLVNLCIGFLLLIVLHLVMGGVVGLATLWIPALFLVQFTLTVGLALLLSCGHVLFRDVGNTVAVALMFGFYASPVFYPLELVRHSTSMPAWVVNAYMANPMAELLTCYRQVLFEQRFPDAILLVWPVCCAVLVFLSGLILFRRNAPTMADHL